MKNNSKFTIIKFDPKKDPEFTQKALDAFLRLHNSQDNLQFLSFTGVAFKREMFEGWWLSENEEPRYDMKVTLCFALTENGEIAGFCSTRENIFESFEIIGLVIDEKYRNMGLAGELLDNACKIAVDAGFKAADGVCFANNKKILRLLIEKDFIPISFRYHWRYDGVDALVLRKYL